MLHSAFLPKCVPITYLPNNNIISRKRSNTPNNLIIRNTRHGDIAIIPARTRVDLDTFLFICSKI